MELNSKKMSPLTGIKVIDHSTALAGPYCTQLLGDLGADVIKIERPDGGDQSRGWGPPFIGSESAYFLGTNRNKRGMTLNLASNEGQEIFHTLLKKTDVLVHNIPRESSRKKLALDEKTCRKLNPKLIWTSISGFGNSGPYAGKPGYDILAQAMSGTMQVTGEVGQPPMRFPTAMADISAGIYAAMAILAALFARERTGRGQSIDTALLDSQVTWLAYLASNYFATGESPKKLGNAHPSIVPYQPFETADSWIMVAVGSDKLWQAFTKVLAMTELTRDPRFVSNADRIAHRQELMEILAPKLKSKSTRHWLSRFEKVDIPASPIYAPNEALTDAHLHAREMIVEIEHPLLGTLKTLGNPMKLSETPVTYRRPAPMLSEHTKEILLELGYRLDDIHNFKKTNVI